MEAAIHGGSPAPALAVTGAGWRALATTERPLPQIDLTSPNPLGPHLAACLAAGFVFKTAYGKHRQVDAELDLWPVSGEDGPELAGVELPAAYVLGLGAVGAAFGFTLACARGLKGTFAAVDPQKVSDTDLNRLLTAIPAVEDSKAELFAGLFTDSHIIVEPFRGRWPRDYLGDPDRRVPPGLGADESAGRYRWVISCVDRNRDRADIAALLPRHILSGSTVGMAAQTSYFSLVGACECMACRHRTPQPARRRGTGGSVASARR